VFRPCPVPHSEVTLHNISLMPARHLIHSTRTPAGIWPERPCDSMRWAQAQAALARGALGDPGRAYLACLTRGRLSPIGPAAWRDTMGARTGDAGLDWAALRRGAAAGAGRAADEGACLGEAARAAAAGARARAAPAASRAAQVRQLAAAAARQSAAPAHA